MHEIDHWSSIELNGKFHTERIDGNTLNHDHSRKYRYCPIRNSHSRPSYIFRKQKPSHRYSRINNRFPGLRDHSRKLPLRIITVTGIQSVPLSDGWLPDRANPYADLIFLLALLIIVCLIFWECNEIAYPRHCPWLSGFLTEAVPPIESSHNQS